jgi:hypothetical protein
MTIKEKEDAFNEFMQISNDISRIPNQYQQLQAHLTLYSEFFERLWNKGYVQGLKEGKVNKEIKISKQN